MTPPGSVNPYSSPRPIAPPAPVLPVPAYSPPPAPAADSPAPAIDTQDQVSGTDKTRSPAMDPKSVTLAPNGKAIDDAERALKQMAGPAYTRLSSQEHKQLTELLAHLDPAALQNASVQGAGSKDKGSALTGSGAGGHYVNSSLTSLAQLMQTGRLKPELLKALNTLATQKMEPALEPQRQALLESTLQNIAFPEKINQHARGSCASGALEIMLAIQKPEQYVGILQSLASPAGLVGSPPLAAGAEVMKRKNDTLADDKSGRNLASRLLQPAFMEYADGERLQYDNTKDAHFYKGQAAHTGLTVPEIEHLTAGLFGDDARALGGNTQAEKLANAEECLKQGYPVAIGMALNGGGHEVLLTGIDRSKNQAYFMNPWGELQTRPLDELQENLIAGVANAGVPATGKTAMESLPGAASKPENYVPIFSTPFSANPVKGTLDSDPSFRSLSGEQKQQLVERFDKLKMPPRELERFLHISQASGNIPQGLLDRLQSAQNADEATKTLRLYERVAVTAPPAAQANRLLAAAPDKNLSSKGFEGLMDSLDNKPGAPPLADWITASEAKIAGKAGPISAQELRDKFETLKKGPATELAYEKLEQLAALADADTKAYMMRRFMEGDTPARSERAISVIFNSAHPDQQRELLNKVDLKSLGSELENADQAAGILTVMTRLNLPPKELEGAMNRFMEGVKTNNHSDLRKSLSTVAGFFYNKATALYDAGMQTPGILRRPTGEYRYLVNQDAKVAASFLRKLDDKTLAALPDSMKARFLNAISDNDLGNKDLQAILPRLVPLCSDETVARTTGRLMDGYTNGREEKAIAQILMNTKPQQMRNLVEKHPGYLRRLADELDVTPLAQLMVKLSHEGNWPAATVLFAHDDHDHNHESDNLASAYVSRLNKQQLDQVPKYLLHRLHTAMDEGWTTDYESQMMDRLKSAKNW